jgi:hypothetical protein
MSGPILYSTNPWFATDVARRYRSGKFFAWVCECFDASQATPGSAAAMIAPSSSPREIYENLQKERRREEKHSPVIKGYKKTFTRLANDWLSDGSITQAQRDEIAAAAKAPAWNHWRPVLYIIPRAPIEASGRLIQVPHSQRASYGPEMKIIDLQAYEFDIVELSP